jgi:hypothetical protein
MFVGNGTTYTQDNCIILGTNTDIDFYTGASPLRRMNISNAGQVIIGATQSTDTTGALLTFPIGSYIYWGANSSGNTRNWAIRNNELSTGDFAIKSSSTNTGALDSVRFQITKEGVTSLFGTNGSTRLKIQNTDNTGYMGFTEQEVVMYRPDGSGADMTIATRAISGTLGAGAIIFETKSVARMRIDGGGDFYIATTTNPVAASSGSGGWTYAAGAYQVIATNSGVSLYLNRIGSDGGVLNFRKNGTDVGSVSVTASLTSYNVTSDYRLKQDFKDFNALELVSNIKTYDYEWKVDKTRMYGVIAHELKEILPYAVNGEKDEIDENGNDKMQGVDYSKLTPILVKAIQELKAEIEILKNK